MANVTRPPPRSRGRQSARATSQCRGRFVPLKGPHSRTSPPLIAPRKRTIRLPVARTFAVAAIFAMLGAAPNEARADETAAEELFAEGKLLIKEGRIAEGC